jgi:hypothetical protein
MVAAPKLPSRDGKNHAQSFDDVFHFFGSWMQQQGRLRQHPAQQPTGM